MIDITELALREKFEAWAEEAEGLPWGYLKKRRTSDDSYYSSNITDMWAAWKAASTEMVEALEKAQADGSEYAASERAEAVKNVALQDEIYGLKSRIAELESRTVKLPHLPDDCDRADANFYYMKALDDAGIKWEAE